MSSPAQIFAGAVAQLRQGQKKAAADLLDRYVAVEPRDHRGWFLLGTLRAELGDSVGALPQLRRAVEMAPNEPDYLNNYGAALLVALRGAEAVGAFQAATRLRPAFPDAWRNLGRALFEARRYGEAVAAFRRTLQQVPADAAAWNGLGGALLAGYADYAGARGAYEKAVAYKPDFFEARSNLLLLMNYDPGISAEQQRDASVAWARQFQATLRAPLRTGTATPVRRDDRRRRLGFLSPDLHDHSVARFLLPLLAHIDRDAYFIALYADRTVDDGVRARLRGMADLWHDTASLSAESLAQRIAADGIETLVDLAGHTAFKLMQTVAMHPAALHISWLGYPATTGIEAVKFRLTDAVADPDAAAQRACTETLIPLAPSFLCFEPLHAVPLSAEVPIRAEVLAERPFAFGSFNSIFKFSMPTIETWSALLRRVPTARLILKAHASDDPTTRAHFEKLFAARGIEKSRLTWLPYAATAAAHLRMYDQVDVALDPFPYNGTTTTCEALWMGVPVVALRGNRHVARVSASLLTTLGRPEWIAETPEQYVEIAARLAEDRAESRGGPDGIRAALRAQMQASPLCDAPAFARRFEAALEKIWPAPPGGAPPPPQNETGRIA